MVNGRIARFSALFSAAIAIATMSGCRSEISGKYIARFTNGMYWLQLVRTPDNHLTGQLESAILGQDGNMARETVAVTGAVNGETVTISASMFGLQVVTLSGTLDGSTLSLTGGQPNPIVLKRADLNDYQRQVDELNTQSQRITSAKAAELVRQRTAQAQQTFVAAIGRIVNRMRELDSEADVHLGRFPGAEDRYRAITAKMNEYLNNERQLAGTANTAVARGQIVVAMNQASIATEQLHNSAISLQSSVQGNVEPVVREANDLEQGCRGVVPPGDLTPNQVEARDAGCRQLFPAVDAFRHKFEAVSRGLSRLEQVYLEERKAQEALLQKAQRVE
jgi:hypothetical protein